MAKIVGDVVIDQLLLYVINNTGDCPLEISAINSSAPAFMVPDVVSFPLAVSMGASITVPLRFQPIAIGAASATISIVSNDPGSPKQMQVEGRVY